MLTDELLWKLHAHPWRRVADMRPPTSSQPVSGRRPSGQWYVTHNCSNWMFAYQFLSVTSVQRNYMWRHPNVFWYNYEQTVLQQLPARRLICPPHATNRLWRQNVLIVGAQLIKSRPVGQELLKLTQCCNALLVKSQMWRNGSISSSVWSCCITCGRVSCIWNIKNVT